MKAIQLIKLLEVKAPPVPKLRPLKVYFEYDIYEPEYDKKGNFEDFELDVESQKYGEDSFDDIFDLAIRNYDRKPKRKGEYFYGTEIEDYDDIPYVKFNFVFSTKSGFTQEEVNYLEYLFSLRNENEISKIRHSYKIPLPKTTKPKVEID